MMTRARTAGQSSEKLDLSGLATVRVGILSDTHGVLDPRLAERLEGCDLLVHAGDVGGSGVLTALRAITPLVLAVRGNNDSPEKLPVDERSWAARLPLLGHAMLPGGELAVEHGDRYPARDRHARLRAAHPRSRAVVFGHSHRLAVDRETSPWILNPGAAGRARTFGGASCIVLDATAGRWRLSVFRVPPMTASRSRVGRAQGSKTAGRGGR